MAYNIKLFDGIEVPYIEENRSFRVKREWWGYMIPVDLVCQEPDNDSVPALKYTYEKLFGDQDYWNDVIWTRLSEKLVKILNNLNEDDEKITEEDLKDMLVPYHIAITFRGNINVFKTVNNRVEVTYKVNDDSDDLVTYSICGSLEDGFYEFYANETPILGKGVLKPHQTSSGDWFEFDEGIGAYTATIDFGQYEVDVFIEPNPDLDDAEAGFALFEKVYAKGEKLDALAREKVLSVVKPEKAEEIDEMYLAMIVCTNSGRVEFSYSLPEVTVTAIGNADGFDKVMLDSVE